MTAQNAENAVNLLMKMEGMDTDIGVRKIKVTGTPLDGGCLSVLPTKEGRFLGFMSADNIRPAIGLIIAGRYETIEELKDYTKETLEGHGVTDIEFKEDLH